MTATPVLARRALARVAVTILLVMAIVAFARPARADESPALFFVRQPVAHVANLPPHGHRLTDRERVPRRRVGQSGVHSQIAAMAAARLGSEWVATALRIADIESRGNCAAYNRGAIGVFQVRNPERFGVSRAAARTCVGGITAGIAHMRMCLDKGARSSGQMMVCHNTGTPYARRVERAYRMALRR